MSLAMRILLIVGSVLTACYVLRRVRKSRMRTEDSVFWLVFSLILCIFLSDVTAIEKSFLLLTGRDFLLNSCPFIRGGLLLTGGPAVCRICVPGFTFGNRFRVCCGFIGGFCFRFCSRLSPIGFPDRICFGRDLP